MRVILTETYFEPSVVVGVTGRAKENPGVAFAWFNKEGSDRNIDLSLLISDYSFAFGLADTVDMFLDSAIRGVSFLTVMKSSRVANHNIVDALKETSVVIERSPPDAVAFSKLLAR